MQEASEAELDSSLLLHDEAAAGNVCAKDVLASDSDATDVEDNNSSRNGE